MTHPLASADKQVFEWVWSQTQDQQKDAAPIEDEEFELEEWDWQEPLAPRRVEPSPRRWAITFGVIAVLLISFSLIIFWGFIRSDWLYGTYGEISPAQWDQIAALRDQLDQLGIAPEAVGALDDALLPPRPSTQDVLRSLKKAVRALDDAPAAGQIQAKLRALIVALRALIVAIEDPDEPAYEMPTATPWPTLAPSPVPTLTPISAAPVAQDNESPPN